MPSDITIVAADVRPLPGCITRRFTAGGTIPVGAPVYLSAADTVSAAAGGTVATSFAIGVLVAVYDPATAGQAASGEMVDVAMKGPVAGYSTNMAHNIMLYVDDNAGVICDTTGTAKTIIGIGLSASVMYVNPIWVTLS
jgi:hypothetical protein